MFLAAWNFLKVKVKGGGFSIFSFFSAPPKSLNRERRVLFFLIFCLTLFGLLFVYESSSLYSLKYRQDAAFFFKRQVFFFLLGLAAFGGALFLDLNFIRRHSKKGLLFLFLILAAVLFFGEIIGGARRWVGPGLLRFQPSELAKIFFLVYCADYCSRKEVILKNFRYGLLPLLFILSLVCFFLLLQPDLGGAIFWVAWLLIFSYLFGAKLKHLLAIILGGGVSVAALIVLYPYRVRRITAYLNPFADPLGAGFQLVQSQLAYGRGGLFGVGLGEGRQKLFFLPAAHTDFIFSIIAEELGFLVTLGIIFIFFLIIHKMLKIAKFCTNQFRRGLLLGIAVIFFLEVFINIGVTCGLLPTKGMPLPFISYGGTSLVVHFFLLGLFFNASKASE